MNIESSHVVSLQRTPHRLKAFWDKFPADWPFPHPIVFPAVDGSVNVPPIDFTASPGAWGCLQSHMRIVENMNGPALIFEDDAELLPDAGKIILEALKQIPHDADMLFIGGQHFLRPEMFAPGIVRCKETGRTHAYIIFPRFRRLFLEICRRSQTHIDHELQYWMRLHDNLKCYAIDPFCALQMENESLVVGRLEPRRSFDDRVPASVRHALAVPIIWLHATIEQARKMRDKGEIFYGYDASDLSGGYDPVIALAGAMKNSPIYPKTPEGAALMAQDQAREILGWIHRQMPTACCFKNCSLAIFHPDIIPEAIEIVAKKHAIHVLNTKE